MELLATLYIFIERIIMIILSLVIVFFLITAMDFLEQTTNVLKYGFVIEERGSVTTYKRY